MTDDATSLVYDLMAQSAAVRSSYAHLFADGKPGVPVPFFGELAAAQVATIGLNPSDTEFHNGRWDGVEGADRVAARLTQYFSNANVEPHKWFKTWSDALKHIGVSYASGSAAHIDVCPWATMPMSKFQDKQDKSDFTALVKSSAESFKRCLQMASQLRLILIAGTVNNGCYLNEYLQSLRLEGMELKGSCKRPGGRGFVLQHQLCISEREIPVYFFSVSPSARTKCLLPQRVQKFSDDLKLIISRNTV
jgi:hypothetical protein